MSPALRVFLRAAYTAVVRACNQVGLVETAVELETAWVDLCEEQAWD